MANKDLQRRIRNESPFNIYVNCWNHRLALCFTHLMKMKDFRELLVEFDSLLLGLWKLFRYSPKRGSVLEKVQISYQKKSLKILKAYTTRWLSHGIACKRVLERFEELLITLDNLIEQS